MWKGHTIYLLDPFLKIRYVQIVFNLLDSYFKIFLIEIFFCTSITKTFTSLWWTIILIFLKFVCSFSKNLSRLYYVASIYLPSRNLQLRQRSETSLGHKTMIEGVEHMDQTSNSVSRGQREVFGGGNLSTGL